MLKKICKDCKTVYDFDASGCKCGGELQFYLIPKRGLNKILSKVKSIFSPDSLEDALIGELNQLNQWETLFKHSVMFNEAKKDDDFSHIDLDGFFEELNDFKKVKSDFELLDNLVVEGEDYEFLLEGYRSNSMLIDELDTAIDKIKSLKLDITVDAFLGYLRDDNDEFSNLPAELSDIMSYDNIEYIFYYNKNLKLNINNLNELKDLCCEIDGEIDIVGDLRNDFAKFNAYFKNNGDKPSNYDSFKNAVNGLNYLDVLKYFDKGIESDADQVKEFIAIFDEFEKEKIKYDGLKPDLDNLYDEFNKLGDEDVNDLLKQEFLNRYSELIEDINSFNYLASKKDISEAQEFFDEFDSHWQGIVSKHEELEKILSFNDSYESFYNLWNDFLASIRDDKDVEQFLDNCNDLNEAILSFKWYDTQNEEYINAISKANDIGFKLEHIDDFVSVNNADLNISEFFHICENKYVGHSYKNDLKIKYGPMGKLEALSNEIGFKEDGFKRFNETLEDFDNFIKNSNDKFVSKELDEYDSFFSNIDGKSLDDNQRRSVVIDEDNIQVIAGAGCGKTLTISAKIRYLLDKGVKAEDILCLSFSKASVSDLIKKLPQGVKASTFHALGKGIYEEAIGEKVIVRSDLLNEVINDFFLNYVLEDEEFLEKVTNYFTYYSYDVADRKDKNLGEIFEIDEGKDFTTLKQKFTRDDEKTTFKNNQKVRSFEELLIANYLFIHGINYEYEMQYLDSEGEKVREWSNYKPDFYLTDYDIYLEHFGVNRNLDAPWLDEERSNQYKQGIFDKRDLHKKHGTKLIETYSYYVSENILMDKLEEILKENGVEIKEVNYEEILRLLSKNDKLNAFESLIKLIESFISLFKGNNYDLSKFDEFKKQAEMEDIPFNRQRHLIFLDIVEEIYKRYEKELENPDFIDFNDMINYSADMISQNKVSRNYKYVIVDEYQDISYSRFKLLKELQKATNAKLFVVGDDWQSIYRFTGCDVSLFTEFKKHSLGYEMCRIENTYRNSQSLIDIAGKFIKENPEQIDKNLKSNLDMDIKNPIKIAYYDNYKDKTKTEALEKCILDISRTSKNILILARYNFSIDPFIKTEGTPFVRNGDKIIYKKNPSLNIKFLTVHASKGLEEDNVILIDLKDDYLGFPSKKEDDGVLKYVVDEKDQFEFAEERRLFYVAMTRTKKYNYFLVDESKPSKFVEEIGEWADFDIIHKLSHDHENDMFIRTKLKCPVCKTGTITILNYDKTFRKFICSHRACEFDGGFYKGKFDDLDILENCPDCDGVLHVYYRNNGPIGTCSNYIGSKCYAGKHLKGKYNHLIKKFNEEKKNDSSDDKDSSKSKNLKVVGKCPQCGNDLVIRNGKFNKFVGCKSFPNCRYTCQLDELEEIQKTITD